MNVLEFQTETLLGQPGGHRRRDEPLAGNDLIRRHLPCRDGALAEGFVDGFAVLCIHRGQSEVAISFDQVDRSALSVPVHQAEQEMNPAVHARLETGKLFAGRCIVAGVVSRHGRVVVRQRGRCDQQKDRREKAERLAFGAHRWLQILMFRPEKARTLLPVIDAGHYDPGPAELSGHPERGPPTPPPTPGSTTPASPPGRPPSPGSRGTPRSGRGPSSPSSSTRHAARGRRSPGPAR